MNALRCLKRILPLIQRTNQCYRDSQSVSLCNLSLDRSHPLRFAKEKYEITPLLKLSELDKLNEYFSTFLSGSDQMWNYHLCRPYKQSYFFDFVNDDKI